MDRIDRNSPPTFPFNYFPCLKPLWERVQSLANYFYTQFMDFYWGKPLPKENPYDVARLDESLKERDLARDIAAWEGVSIAVDNLVNGIFNLSGINKPLERAHPSGFPLYASGQLSTPKLYFRHSLFECCSSKETNRLFPQAFARPPPSVFRRGARVAICDF